MNRSIKSMATAIIMMLVMVLTLTGCRDHGAKEAVRHDLEALRTHEIDEELSDNLDGILNDNAKEYFEDFLDKYLDFDYSITGSEKQDDGSVVVTVRIETYSFGREYLETWTQYLKLIGEAEPSPADFYEMLMKNLGSLELKAYSADADIVCTRNDEGDWVTDVDTNQKLRDALLGGMLTEIAGLADIGWDQAADLTVD